MNPRVATYARFSSEMQRASSIADQVALARQYAGQIGWDVLADHIYKDEAMSGLSLERPGIQALRAAAAQQPRPFDVLLVEDTSRISRDPADAIRFLQEMKFLGVRVICISQNIDSASPQAQTLVAVHGVVDGLYSAEMAQKIKRGLKGQHSRGYATGGQTFGYRTVPVLDPSGKRDPSGYPALLGKRIEVVPEEAEIVRFIFEWYAAGAGTSTIVERLQQVGISVGKDWKAAAVKRVLTNERYRGYQIWGQKTFDRRPGTRQMVARVVPRAEWQMTERPDLRIVSEELWHRARERQREVQELFGIMTGRPLARGKNGRAYSKHLFTGRLRCGVCGGGITTVCSGHGSPRYGCGRSWKNGPSSCPNRLTVRAKIADSVLIAGLEDMLRLPATLELIASGVSAEVSRILKEAPNKRNQLHHAIAEGRRKLANLIAVVEDGGATPSLRDAIRTRETEIERLQAQFVALEEPAREHLAVMPSWVREQLHDLVGVLMETPERTRTELSRLDVSFTLTPVTPDEGRPYLRAEGATDISRILAGHTHGSAVDRSLPRPAP